MEGEDATLPSVSEKLCRVSCHDAAGAEHSVEVKARTLYEAVGRGLQIFRANDWVDGIGRNWALTVVVKAVRSEALNG